MLTMQELLNEQQKAFRQKDIATAKHLSDTLIEFAKCQQLMREGEGDVRSREKSSKKVRPRTDKSDR